MVSEALSWHKPMQGSTQALQIVTWGVRGMSTHGKTCCTADIPHVVGPFDSLLFLKVQLLALHTAEQVSSIKWGEFAVSALHSVFLFFPSSQQMLHVLTAQL